MTVILQQDHWWSTKPNSGFVFTDLTGEDIEPYAKKLEEVKITIDENNPSSIRVFLLSAWFNDNYSLSSVYINNHVFPIDSGTMFLTIFDGMALLFKSEEDYYHQNSGNVRIWYAPCHTYL